MKPLRKLDRYLLREIGIPFVVGVSLFFVLVSFGQLVEISDSVTGLGVGGTEVFRALMYAFPPLLGLILPVATLFATLLGIGRLASDRELIAFDATGVSPYSTLRVPLALASVVACIAAAALVYGEPWGLRSLRSLMNRSAQSSLTRGIEPGKFVEWVPGVIFLARDAREGELRDVVFADRRDADNPVVIGAEAAVVEAGVRAEDVVFDMRQGSMMFGDRQAESHRTLRFETGEYRLNVGHLVGNKLKTVTHAQYHDYPDLWLAITSGTLDTATYGLFVVTAHRKLALPVAALIFVLLAVPLASRSRGGARARGFLYSAAIIAGYYYAGRAAELSARAGRMNPVLAAWLPNLIGLSLAAYLLWRLPRRRT